MHLPLESAYKGSFGNHAIHNICTLMLALHFFYFLTRCLGKTSHHLRLFPMLHIDQMVWVAQFTQFLVAWPANDCLSLLLSPCVEWNSCSDQCLLFVFSFPRGCLGSVFRGRRTTPATMNVAINHNMFVQIQSATIAPIPDGSHVPYVDPCFSPDQAI